MLGSLHSMARHRPLRRNLEWTRSPGLIVLWALRLSLIDRANLLTVAT